LTKSLQILQSTYLQHTTVFSKTLLGKIKSLAGQLACSDFKLHLSLFSAS